jgi:biotin carboxyl carrier protein
MKFQLDVAEQLRTVEVQRQPHGFRIIVDDRAHLVEAVRIGRETWSLIVMDADGSRARSVEAIVVPQNGNGSFDVYVDGYHIPVAQRTGQGRRSRELLASHGAGPQRVQAPMPGRVVRVLVKAGDAVQARQPLIVVEAMKMENELRAAREGRVRELFVTEGQSVEAGTALLVVE